MGCWTVAFGSSLDLGQRIFLVLCDMILSIGEFTTWQLISGGQMRERETERHRQREKVIVF